MRIETEKSVNPIEFTHSVLPPPGPIPIGSAPYITGTILSPGSRFQIGSPPCFGAYRLRPNIGKALVPLCDLLRNCVRFAFGTAMSRETDE